MMLAHAQMWNHVLTVCSVTKVKLQTILDQLASTEELTGQQMVVLFGVHNHTVSTVGEISKTFLLQQANISALTKKLEAGGLLTRARNEVDVRIVDLSLTAAGHEKVQRLIVRIEEIYHNLLADESGEFNVAEIQSGFAALSKMIDYLYEQKF